MGGCVVAAWMVRLQNRSGAADQGGAQMRRREGWGRQPTLVPGRDVRMAAHENRAGVYRVLAKTRVM